MRGCGLPVACRSRDLTVRLVGCGGRHVCLVRECQLGSEASVEGNPRASRSSQWGSNCAPHAHRLSLPLWQAEKERFDAAWKKCVPCCCAWLTPRRRSQGVVSPHRFEAQVTKRALKAKLKRHWVPQMDQTSGATYYLNLKNAQTQEEHPNLRLARVHSKKQRVKAEAALAERLSVLTEYRDKIYEGEARYREQVRTRLPYPPCRVCDPWHDTTLVVP